MELIYVIDEGHIELCSSGPASVTTLSGLALMCWRSGLTANTKEKGINPGPTNRSRVTCESSIKG